MFQNISWQSYWLTVALLTAGYYLVVYLLYFRSDFQVFLPGKKSRTSANPSVNPYPPENKLPAAPGGASPAPFEEDLAADFRQPPRDSEEDTAYRCMDELNAFFEQAQATRWTTDTLIRSLRNILKKYPSLETSSYRDSLHKVLVNQCEQFCSVHLSAEEAVRVWLDE